MQHAMETPDYLFKILLVGDSGVGKSSLVTQYAEKTFSPSFISTIGVDFQVVTKKFRDKLVKLQIWDTAGQERFRAITSSYYRGAHAVIIVTDVEDPESLWSVTKTWLPQVRAYARDDVSLFMVANKTDLEDPEKVEDHVREEAGVARDHSMLHMRVSAKTGLMVNETFEKVVTHLMDKYLQIQAMKDSQKDQRISLSPPPAKKDCCGS